MRCVASLRAGQRSTWECVVIVPDLHFAPHVNVVMFVYSDLTCFGDNCILRYLLSCITGAAEPIWQVRHLPDQSIWVAQYLFSSRCSSFMR